jgi:hypothetical protein
LNHNVISPNRQQRSLDDPFGAGHTALGNFVAGNCVYSRIAIVRRRFDCKH